MGVCYHILEGYGSKPSRTIEMGPVVWWVWEQECMKKCEIVRLPTRILPGSSVLWLLYPACTQWSFQVTGRKPAGPLVCVVAEELPAFTCMSKEILICKFLHISKCRNCCGNHIVTMHPTVFILQPTAKILQVIHPTPSEQPPHDVNFFFLQFIYNSEPPNKTAAILPL